MGKMELIKEIMKITAVSKETATKFYEAFLFILGKSIAQEGKVVLQDIGTFLVTYRGSRRYVHPINKEDIIADPRWAVVFRQSAKLKEQVNNAQKTPS